jgi:hypothetical protein
VYELATGNNAVVSMTWDAAQNALYAATECGYDSYGDEAWPKQAFHTKNYFGYAFNAGEH